MRTITIGNTAVLSASIAKDVARRVLLRAQTHGNPAQDRARTRTAPGWGQFLDEYWRRISPSWKPSTARTHSIYRRQHLDGAFPAAFIDEVSEEDVIRWFSKTTQIGGPGAANRTLAILAAMLNRAEAWGYRKPNTNPCSGVRRNPQRRCERFLDHGELGRLGAALEAFAQTEPLRVAAIRLILLTGCRKSEIANLRWSNVKGQRLLLEDAKTGPRTVWLGTDARKVLQGIPRKRGVIDVFPVSNRDRDHWLSNVWSKVRERAGLKGLRLHDLRHSFASFALRSQETLPVIGRLLGHANVRMTARYAHLDDSTAREANEAIGALLVALTGAKDLLPNGVVTESHGEEA
ncbi:tyrosine-type recombinase/integrase [Novosphingobium sp. BL-52-GroH]|uniref:tyrosine-type recombinase/integrase n=1 Tax=Novosphingobium sp. BL-52-GroH TaxID=3349877 RepID=UPI00384BB5FB